MQYSLEVRLIDLIGALSRALDLVSSILADHHAHTGYLASRIAAKLELDAATQRDVLIGAMLHDAGALSLHPSVDSLRFERDLHLHARAGHILLKTCPRLTDVAELVHYHHTPWSTMQELPDAPAVSNIISLADFIDVQLDRCKDPLEQLPLIASRLETYRGRAFNPEYLDAFLELVASPGSLDGLRQPEQHLQTGTSEQLEQEMLDIDAVHEFSNVFSLIIDFRSKFTATHSRGVAETARALAKGLGYDSSGQKLLAIAGLLHDIGKLAVPKQILEKPSGLSDDEFRTIQEHPLIAESILGNVCGMEQIHLWSFEHHERINGSGYPHKKTKDELSLGSRILQVADVFTAITEDRPYREGMNEAQAKLVLTEQAEAFVLDPAIVNELVSRFEEINAIRIAAQRSARASFDQFYTTVHSEQTAQQ